VTSSEVVVSARFGVFYGTLPCSFALYTCLCGAAVVEDRLDRSAPAGWHAAGNDVHLCPGCARTREEGLEGSSRPCSLEARTGSSL
jgi:hypothetical protein